MTDEFYERDNESDGENEYEDPEVPTVRHPEPTPANPSVYKTRPSARYEHALDEIFRILRWFWKLFTSASFWTASATVVIAVATIFYTLYAKKQWKEMQKTTKAAQEAAVAAQKAADTAASQLELAE